MENTLNQADAIKILIKAVQIAQKKGVYNLEEAATIHKAVSIFLIKNESSDKHSNTVNNVNSITNLDTN